MKNDGLTKIVIEKEKLTCKGLILIFRVEYNTIEQTNMTYKK